MKPLYIASCSFGKDSLATILLALKNNEPLDRIVFAEVMFDRERNISAEIPEHIEWIYGTAIPILKEMGVTVDVVRSERDYVGEFMRSRERGKYAGLHYGFPIGGHCVINRDCKIKPIHDYYAKLREGLIAKDERERERERERESIIQYVGIALDEPRRLARLKPSQISLLAKYGYTEAMALELCRKNHLLSPIYASGTRGGCWCCPNANVREYCRIRSQHPELWNELRQLDAVKDKISKVFKWGKELWQVELQMDELDGQSKLF